MMRDRAMAAKVKGKIYIMVVRCAMRSCLETGLEVELRWSSLETKSSESEMIWTSAKEELWIYWTNHVEHGKRGTTVKIHGCNVRGHGG